MMKEKRLLIVLLAALLAFSLFGCGKKVDAPSDVTVVIEDADLDDTATSDSTADTTGTTGVKGDTTGTSADKLTSLEQQEKTTKTELQGDELFTLFRQEYDMAKEWQKLDKECGTDFYKKYSDPSVSYTQQRDIGTLEDANVYYLISRAVYGINDDGYISDPDYFNNYVLPSDGFEQYVAWREAQTSSSGQNGNTGSSGSQSTQDQQVGSPSSGNTNSGSNNGTGNTGNSTVSSSGNNTSGGPSDGEGENVPGNGYTLSELDWEAIAGGADLGGTSDGGGNDYGWNRIN